MAHGANYHQGLEWVWWPVGFLVRALLSLRSQVRAILARLQSHLEASDWLGLPELANSRGRCHTFFFFKTSLYLIN